ncbi:hypothetical protein [Aquabacterium sp.]|uniref:hypothetical protein n=1 Tax=Aquabacterium sp. TaxID=1872578 RepID=UPI002C00B9EB|nr:hypothetical protein [Aquabacterium sp.]HSW03924.1 hypothetical protein [Aquabacterium sp.]
MLLFMTAFLGLWPLVFLMALLRHSLARRWRRVGQVALLLPLWTIAASVGLTQMAPVLALLEGRAGSRSAFVATLALGFALCCAAVAWALLVRSFGSLPAPGSGQQPVASPSRPPPR